MARVIGKVNREAQERIAELLGDKPSVDKLTPDAWREIQGMYDRALLPQLETVFNDAADAMVDSVSGGIEWDLINKRAADWARTATNELVRGITDNSRTVIQDSVTDFYNERLTLGDLKERLARTFGARRAESIAITETTRAAAQGEKAYAEELRKQGVQLVAIWNTANDSRTCSICGPRDGKQQGDGWEDLPPAHPRCRCGVSYVTVAIPDTVTAPTATPSAPVTMPYGADIPPDVGTPGRTVESLNVFLDQSEGALARALKGIDDDDFEHSLLNINFDTDKFEVNKENVKYQADIFLNESRYMVNYNKRYLLDMVQERLDANGLAITDPFELESIYNRDYAYKAKAIISAADVGGVRLTDAQRRRLNEAADGGYLNMVLTEKDNRTRHTGPEKMRGSGNYSASASARREKREQFLEVLGRLG